MSLPRQINDGDWSLPNVEMVDLSYPFSLQGDGVSFEATLKVTQDKLAYRPAQIGDRITVPGVIGNSLLAYLIDQGDPKDIGNGLFEIRRVYASIPQSRTEPSSTVLTIPIGVQAGNLINITNTYAANVVYEYALQPFKVLTSLKAYQLGNITYIQPASDGHTIGIPNKGPYLADDSEVGIYKGAIYYRRSIYAIIPKSSIFTE